MLTPLEIYSILESTAVDMEDPGFDFDSGYGYVDALAAIRLASPPTVDPTAAPMVTPAPAPAGTPTAAPTAAPTGAPTMAPTTKKDRCGSLHKVHCLLEILKDLFSRLVGKLVGNW